MKRLVISKRLSQAFFLVLFIYILWSTTYPLKGIFPPETFFKINPLIVFITSLSEKTLIDGIAFSIIMIFFTLILGRFFCGWVCPLGTTIDMAGALRKRNPLPNDMTNRILSRPKFFILGIIILSSLLGVQIAWILDPMVIMARFVSLNFIPAVTSVLDKLLVSAIKAFGLYGPVYDFYRMLKSSILGINTYHFSHSLIILAFFLLVVGNALFLKRFWCRALCPLGAIYALAARFSLLRRVIKNCAGCVKCKSICRMGAIKDDSSYIKGECILCMDCIYDCPQHITAFKWPILGAKDAGRNDDDGKNGITRRGFMIWLLSSSFLFFGFRKRKKVYNTKGVVIRPPAALEENTFVDRCIRCGNCMKACITNGLQPVLFQTGLSGIWTPQLVPEIGYCEYHCTLCGNVCPTGAIPGVTPQKKIQVRLGLAKIDRKTCLPWSQNIECLVCEEHCPVADKAIKLKEERIDNNKVISRPYVDIMQCVGCGICQNKCPVRPERAIKVNPVHAHRS